MADGSEHPQEPRASRRRGCRPQGRRRRRHHDPDPARLLRRRKPSASASNCPGRSTMASAYLFMPREPVYRQDIERIWWETSREEGLKVLGWRDVPVDSSVLGYSVKGTEPVHRQVFIGRGPTIRDEAHFERKLFVCRKVVSNRVLEVLGSKAQDLLSGLGLDPHHRLQGPRARQGARRLLPGPRRPARRVGLRPGAPALLDQHLPELAAGPSLSLRLPQRRNQHGARQLQLDGGAPGQHEVRDAGRRPLEALAHFL